MKNDGCRSVTRTVLQVTLIFATCLSWQLVKILCAILFTGILFFCILYIELVDMCGWLNKHNLKFVFIYTAYEPASNGGLPADFFPRVPNEELETLSAGTFTVSNKWTLHLSKLWIASFPRKMTRKALSKASLKSGETTSRVFPSFTGNKCTAIPAVFMVA